MATDTFKKLNGISYLSDGNIQYSTINGSILDYVKGSCPMGISFAYTQNATDAKAPGSVSITMIVKPSGDGKYSRLYQFLGVDIYHATWQGDIPTSITWVNMT